MQQKRTRIEGVGLRGIGVQGSQSLVETAPVAA